MKLRYLVYALILIISFGIPFLIQFKFNFFGATMVTIGDIIRLWTLIPLVALILVLWLEIYIESK